MMFMMLLTPLLLVGLIVVAAALGTGVLAKGLQPPAKPVTGAREVLAQRYAQGEISKEQYDQILADIAG